MAYLHIENLYANQDILAYKECYAMEKIHGTSAHISYKNGNLAFFSGGEKYERFITLFDQDKLQTFFANLGLGDTSLNIYGEAYGGKCQGMSVTYGNALRFIAFEVKIGDNWLNVPKAEQICKDAGLEFVHYARIPCTLEAIDFERDLPSVQAFRNGMGEHMREGIVLRPLEEVTKSGERVIAKHKRDEFRETKTPRNLTDKLVKMTEVKAIVDEWVTEERLGHILNRGEVEEQIENTGQVIVLMIEDVKREGKEEIEMSKDLEKAIGRETALMFKRRLHGRLLK